MRSGPAGLVLGRDRTADRRDRDGQKSHCRDAFQRCGKILVTAAHSELPSAPASALRSTPARKTLIPFSSTSLSQHVGRELPVVAERTQRERQGSLTDGLSDHLGLSRRQLQRRGLAERPLLGVLASLASEMSDRWQARARRAGSYRSEYSCLVAFIRQIAREDDVDAIVRQNEPAGSGFRRDDDRHTRACPV